MNDEYFGRLEACPPSVHSACRQAVSRINRIFSSIKEKSFLLNYHMSFYMSFIDKSKDVTKTAE